MEKTEYSDRVILALREKYKEKQSELLPVEKEIIIRGKRMALYQALLIGGKFSILLPEIMVDMDEASRIVRYRSLNSPQTIKTDYDSGASLTFSELSITDKTREEEPAKQLEKLRSDIKKVWKQNVFYDQGEITADVGPVAWMDFRAFCLDDSLYAMFFLFQTDEQLLLGNFHCSFSQYDIWKPVMLKLLTTIRIVGGTSNEGISNQGGAF